MEDREKEIILKAVHGDKEEVLQEQHASIEKEIADRKRIDSEVKERIDQDIVEVDTAVMQAQPGNSDEVITLSKERLDLSKEKREEERECWKDIQDLKEEQRGVEKDLLTTEKKKERFTQIL